MKVDIANECLIGEMTVHSAVDSMAIAEDNDDMEPSWIIVSSYLRPNCRANGIAPRRAQIHMMIINLTTRDNLDIV